MDMTEAFSEADLTTRFPPGTEIGTPDFNRIAATNAMIDFFAKRDPSCVDRYFKTPYTNHTTRAGEGIAPVHALAEWATTWEGGHIIVRRALAEGDLVVLHSVYSNLAEMKGQWIAFDLWRFDDGKIVEHWDALEDAVFPDQCGLGQVAGSVDITDRDGREANRDIVTRFVDEVLIKGQADQVGEFLDSQDFVDHTPRREAGLNRDRGIFLPAADAPEVRYLTYHKTLAEGNFVLVQGEARIAESQVLEVYDLFRVKSGKIVEHWDVLQALPPEQDWANQNGPF